MHGVGEIDHRGAARQAQNFAARCKHIDLVRIEIDLDALDEFLGVATLLHLHQVREPGARPLLLRRTLSRVLFIFPVCRDARFRHAIHIGGADLHLDRHRVGPEQRGME